jgi:2-polyprenyl-6-methoxyphenol hydroxylase-like FAD-dependent oxidoreductase
VTEKSYSHAVVIGGSIAGLLAARALADHFAEVTILERDCFPAIGQNRKGVPQGHHTHALLSSGQQALEHFFPGLTAELAVQGAVVADPLLAARRYLGGYYHCQFESGLQGLYLSRPLLEGQVRRRVLALPNVRAMENCDVVGLVASEDQQRITGIRLLHRSGDGAEKTLKAELAIDASGRGSRSPQWLTALGYDKPTEERVHIGMGYVSRYYRRNPDPQGTALVSISAPPQTRMGVLAAQEGERWIVSLAGYLGDYAPTDPDAFLEFARTLPAPDIYAIIKDAEPLSDPVPARFPANTRRRYEQLKHFPEGYLVLGDAICSFNPVYGQGMTVAALEAQVLHELLQQGQHRLAQRFFRRASTLVDNPWDIAVGGDLRIAGVVGKRSPLQRLMARYLDRLHRAAQHDPKVVMAFGKVVGLRAPSKSLLQPSLVWRVLVTNRQSPPAPRPTIDSMPKEAS